MTENEKIELFDKWYDENYDEWAEGEEGIALREELEQAFKVGIAELEKENKVLAQNLEDTEILNKTYEKRFDDLKKENAELKLKLEALEGQTPWKDIKDKSEVIGQLTKAKELLKRLLITSCNSDVLNLLPNCSEVLRVRVEAEQFLSEVEDKGNV